MSQKRYSKKHCSLKNTTVTVLEEAGSEIGGEGIWEWKIRECLSKDKICGDLDCEYVHEGIGNSGTKDPFNKIP